MVHFEDADVHPGGSPCFRVVDLRKHPRCDAAQVVDPLAASVLCLNEIWVSGGVWVALLIGACDHDRLGDRVDRRGPGAAFWCVSSGVAWGPGRLSDGGGGVIAHTSTEVEGVLTVESIVVVEVVSTLIVPDWRGVMCIVRVVHGASETEGVLVVVVEPSLLVVGRRTVEEKGKVIVGHWKLGIGRR